MSTLILRPYQTQAIAEMRELMRQGCHSICYQGATGSGKTALTAHMLHIASSKKMRCWFIVHRRELIKQSSEAFKLEGLQHGIISAGFIESPALRVQLASVQTLGRRLNRTVEPRLIVWDECHHIAASSWATIFRRFPHAYHIGITATPSRLDGKGLGEYFKTLISGPSVESLIKAGYLSPYRLYAPMRVSVDGVHTKMGDYVKSELQGVMDKPSITGDCITHYKKYADGKRALVFCVSIQHSQHVADRFMAQGIQARHVDGETDPVLRDDAMRRFRNGEIKVLTSVEIFGEGVDVPALECVILLRATQSLGLYLQQVGRGLRPAPGKETAIILDHVGNCERHGLPDDERVWTLEGSRGTGSKGSGKSAIKICPRCFAAQNPTDAHTCRFCGFVYEVASREIKEKEGELAEVDLQMRRKLVRIEQGRASTMEELFQIGVSRGYRNPRAWAHFVFQGRQRKKLGG